MLHDTYLDAAYEVETMNAKALSTLLKKGLKAKGIDYKFYNSQAALDEKESHYFDEGHKETQKNPPIEIYEYQQFFLMRKEDGSLVLLDGFRRLLWYNSPDYPINVRIYDYKTMDEKKIIKLLIYLNHFKFVSNIGAYYDRGFGLALNTLFDLNIPQFYKAFDAYLWRSTYYREYSWSNRENAVVRNSRVKERIMHPLYISDMKFIQDLSKEAVMTNDCFGALVYHFRSQYPKTVFKAEEFLKLIKGNTVIKNVYEKQIKNGDGDGSKATDSTNQLLDLYINIFNKMCGVEVEKTYADKEAETKELIEKYKKDKKLFKLTNFRKYPAYHFEKGVVQELNAGKEIVMDIIVYPTEKPDKHSRDFGKEILFYGLYEGISLTHKGKVVKSAFGDKMDYTFFCTVNGVKCQLVHKTSFSNYSHHVSSTFAQIWLEDTDENEKKYIRKYDVEIFTKDINADIIKVIFESR